MCDNVTLLANCCSIVNGTNTCQTCIFNSIITNNFIQTTAAPMTVLTTPISTIKANTQNGYNFKISFPSIY